MEDGVRVRIRPTELLDRLDGGHHDQLHPSALGLGDHIVGDGERSGGAAPQHETSAWPRDVLGGGQRLCPYLPRSAFEGPFFRFRIRPPSITTSCS